MTYGIVNTVGEYNRIGWQGREILSRRGLLHGKQFPIRILDLLLRNTGAFHLDQKSQNRKTVFRKNYTPSSSVSWSFQA
jgi:hypothetical protein